MKLRPIAVFLMCLMSGSLLASQRPQRTPRGPLTFAVTTRQVQVSVVVQDKDGAPVRDLTAKDFQILEEGVEQTIESFSMEVTTPIPAESASGGLQTEFHNQFSGRGGVTVILLDRMNTAIFGVHVIPASERAI